MFKVEDLEHAYILWMLAGPLIVVTHVGQHAWSMHIYFMALAGIASPSGDTKFRWTEYMMVMRLYTVCPFLRWCTHTQCLILNIWYTCQEIPNTCDDQKACHSCGWVTDLCQCSPLPLPAFIIGTGENVALSENYPHQCGGGQWHLHDIPALASVGQTFTSGHYGPPRFEPLHHCISSWWC